MSAEPANDPTLPAAETDFETLSEKAAPKIHADGIYFGLDEDIYHADPAIGSSSMKALEQTPEDYWYYSPHNPSRPKDVPTASQLFGKAVHKFVLEGREAFDACYGPTDLNGSTKAGREEREILRESGREPIKREDYGRILTSGTMIRANPELSNAFAGGMSEVSVFWTDTTEGGITIRKKARFDFLKPRAIVDLKSIRNQMGDEFSKACRTAIARYGYDVQAEHYRKGRIAMARVADNVVGDHDPEFLKQCIAQGENFAFVFCFYQAEGAPLTWAGSLSPGNPILEIAAARIQNSEHNFERFMKSLGPDVPWVEARPLTEIDISELPGWYGR